MGYDLIDNGDGTCSVVETTEHSDGLHLSVEDEMIGQDISSEEAERVAKLLEKRLCDRYPGSSVVTSPFGTRWPNMCDDLDDIWDAAMNE